MIIDAHHHLWKFNTEDYGWMDESMSILKKDYLPADLGEQLEEFSGNPKLVGVRHVIHDEPDDDFILRPPFVKGIEKFRQHNLTYDLLLFSKHLEKAVELASMFPKQKFVLNHISKPFIKAGILDPWREDIKSLAAQPNVWCKISGMVTEADLKNRKKIF